MWKTLNVIYFIYFSFLLRIFFFFETRASYVTQAALELMIPLLRFSEGSHHRLVPHQAWHERYFKWRLENLFWVAFLVVWYCFRGGCAGESWSRQLSAIGRQVALTFWGGVDHLCLQTSARALPSYEGPFSLISTYWGVLPSAKIVSGLRSPGGSFRVSHLPGPHHRPLLMVASSSVSCCSLKLMFSATWNPALHSFPPLSPVWSLGLFFCLPNYF